MTKERSSQWHGRLMLLLKMPVMATEISNYIWAIEEIVSLID
jgi:hypothetical protein